VRRAVATLVSPLENSPAAVLRRAVAGLLFFYAGAMLVERAVVGKGVSLVALAMMLAAFAVFREWGGRGVRDWGLVLICFLGYAAGASALPDIGARIHVTPQIDAERLLFLGTLPTNWLQEHLYHGTGPLEVFTILMYLSHFVVPGLLASLIWLYWPGRGFGDLFFGILLVSLLGEITFFVAPTAPPWMAGDAGVIPHVDHVIRQGLYDIGLDSVAARKDAPGSYNLAAAVPSLHAAWPVIGLLVIRKHRLPRWLFCAQAAQAVGVAFAVVYAGEHYAVDVVAGVLYALIAWWLLGRLFALGSARLERMRSVASLGIDPPSVAPARRQVDP
jgi:PAP2 superfamily protein